ncbi:SDR family NAD(P)-dependent oxidoreductase [Streptomyces sporangiiformans]|uniref:SDR family NAD(P)-dependent oxidoreductase n=1 Tax=Streptomyces sporangiiformans TaxID=2315329 RepID=A0A505DKQ2_9ACTN|nr:SDR family NAD(P)-dependent oxidoreductase [Streptomyces sporangiiformans]TPQ22178.1 SDR family NAD(P)-dependent oxidoreductase [Streptomyces sporangiiformans]
MTSPDVLGQDVLQALADAARAVPGVDDAAAVARKGVRAAEPVRAVPRPEPGPGSAEAPVAAADDVADMVAADEAALPAADLYGGDIDIPDGAPTTLQEGLRLAAELAPDKGTVYITAGHDDVLKTYPELLDEAQHVLGGFRAAGLRPGDAALFVFDDNRGYLTAFWACVLGGFVPTPVAVATTYTSANETNRKLRGAWHLLGRPVLVTDAATEGALSGVRELWDEPDVRILTVEELAGHPADQDWFPATADSPVLNLLTSGSTGVPKCVQHTNASVVARSMAVAQHCGLTGEDISLIWMPFDHVTVAYYNVRDVFLRCLHVNAKIDHFLADPLLWLDWADRYRATNTWAPNFAFALVNERADEIRERSWDLSCLREISNAGEPVIASTSHRFLELLGPHGLPADAMSPCWGMSETCSGVTYSRQTLDDRTAGTVAIDPASLTGTIRHLDPGDPDAVVLSRVGRPIPGVRLRVVDDSGTVLPEGRMGELRITGRTVMAGYFGNEEANREAYDDNGWFRTGDMAFVRDGEVVIAGRLKDQIIVRGINYMAHELESVVERVDGVRVTFSAAAGVREPGAATDQLVVFFVPVSWDTGALARTTEEVRAVLVRESGIAPDLIVPVTEAEFPKTASGKIQRAALVADFRAGRFADRVTGAAAEEPADDTWFFGRQWVELAGNAGTTAGENGASGVRLVLAEDDDLDRLDIDGAVVAVRRGDVFAAQSPVRYRVPAADRAALRRLLAAVTAQHGEISSVVHALPLSLEGEPAERLTAATAELTALIAALADGEFGHPQVLVLTSGAMYARPGDRVDLGVCALPGLVRTAISEAAPLPVRQLDLPADPGTWTRAVHAELADRDRTGLVAARQGRRLEPKLVPLTEDTEDTAGAAASPAGQPVTPGGLYLVTGGLGGIAHDIAAYLVAGFGIRLLLVGRSPAEGEKAARLTELSRLGQVVYEQLDVADAAALHTAVASAEDRWGRPLDGVLHLAAADPTGQWADLEQHTLVNETAKTYAEQYHAKVSGTLAIAQILETRPKASLVLFGSVNGEFGGHSFGAYAAANSFLTGFAEHWHHERRRQVHTLAWSMWTGVGMNRGQSSTAAEHRGFRTIDPDTGLRLFLDAAALPGPYTVIGLDLRNPAMVEELVPQQLRVSEVLLAFVADGADQEALRAAVAASAADCPVPVRVAEVSRIPRDAYGAVDAAQLLLDSAADRPARRFTPPQTELESALALIWSDALARPEIGRDESFFELGGNSLRATRLLALTDQKLGVRVTTQELYERPTVEGMAAVIEQHKAG